MEDFDVHKDFDFLLAKLTELNGKEKVERNEQPMKVAYLLAVARMAQCTEKFDNCSWEETEVLKERIRKQVFDWLDSSEEDMIIANMIAEVNEDIKKEQMNGWAWKAYSWAFDMALLLVFLFVVIAVLYAVELIT